MLSEKYHPEPPSSTKLWRYMDLPKFLSLIHTNRLFFTQVKLLGDSYEGSMRWMAQDFVDSVERPFNREHYNYVRELSFVSCWHMNEFESAAMWKLYQSSNQGIAIQTTVERLTKSLLWDKFGKNRIDQIYTGMVSYRNTPFTTEESDSNGYLTDTVTLFCKRLSFEHEKEYRIVIEGTQGIGERTVEGGSGLAIPLEISTFIEKIYIAPTAPEWIRQLLQSILETKYSLNLPVFQSSLDDQTLW